MTQPRSRIQPPSPINPSVGDPGRRADPTVTVKLSGHMHAYLMQALHQDAYTTSVSRYVRDILAAAIAEKLDISPLQVIANAPDTRRKRRYRPD